MHEHAGKPDKSVAQWVFFRNFAIYEFTATRLVYSLFLRIGNEIGGEGGGVCEMYGNIRGALKNHDHYNRNCKLSL